MSLRSIAQARRAPCGAVAVSFTSHSAACAPYTVARRWRASASHWSSVLSAAFHGSSMYFTNESARTMLIWCSFLRART